MAEANYMFIYFSQDLTVSNDEIMGRVSIKELAPGENQEVEYFIHVPVSLDAGDYHIGYEIDPFETVPESNEDNLFCAGDVGGCSVFNISENILASQKITYPILFVHGLTSNSMTWDVFTDEAERNYGWSFGGRLDYCLNPDGDVNNSDTEILPFTEISELEEGDFYYVNFDVSTTGEPFVSGPFSSSDVQSNQSAIVKQGWAMSDAIGKVLEISGAEKVILVGHSMGGLASRQYLQNPEIWNMEGESQVAKLFTVATPNGGSNATGLGLGALLVWTKDRRQSGI